MDNLLLIQRCERLARENTLMRSAIEAALMFLADGVAMGFVAIPDGDDIVDRLTVAAKEANGEQNEIRMVE